MHIQAFIITAISGDRRQVVLLYLLLILSASAVAQRGGQPRRLATWSLPDAVPPPTNESLRPPSQWSSELARTSRLLTAFKNDRVDRLLAALHAHKHRDSWLELRARLLRARAYERDPQDNVAMPELLRLEETSRTRRRWGIYTDTVLALALLCEENKRQPQTRKYLELARATIAQHGLSEYYPQLANRLASYYRVFQLSRDTALYYACEAVRTAPQYGLPLQEAIGHMLLGILLRDSDYSRAVGHFRQAGKIYLQLDDHTGYSYVNYGISARYFRHGNQQLALADNDTVVGAAQRAIAQGQEAHSALGSAYRVRGEILRARGQFDSAWHYLQQGYEAELALHELDRREKIAEIDARYNDERKSRQLAGQARQLRLARERRYGLAAILLPIGLAVVLAYLYLRLRRTNITLSASLEQQLVLQSEIHHRVKNNLQVIISLLELQQAEIKDPAASRSLSLMASRLYSMAAIHDLLYRQEGRAEVSLPTYIRHLCQHIRSLARPDNPPNFQLLIPALALNFSTLMPLGIILNELLTNSLKYANRPDRQLIIDIRIETNSNAYCLCYRDNGPGLPGGRLQEREGGLGTYLLRSMSRQLNGRLASRNEGGAVFEVEFFDRNG